MQVIRDKKGNVIQRSRNLAGIRRYVGKNIVKTLAVDRSNGAGLLTIEFENGARFDATFASYTVLVEFVRRWRNVHGAPFVLNGEPVGYITYDNPVFTHGSPRG